MDLKELSPYLIGIGSLLLAGKFLKRLIMLPFEYIARKTKTKIDDVLLAEAQKDLGIEEATLEKAEKPRPEDLH